MFKRLFVLVLLAMATLSVSTPAHASTLSASLSCEQTSSGQSFGTFSCLVFVSGGTPGYTFRWYEYAAGTGYFLVSQGESFYDSWCQNDLPMRVKVVVTDSAGAHVERINYFTCSGW